MILVTSSFVTFWIEWNAEPARVTLGVTTMLNFFTTSNKYIKKYFCAKTFYFEEYFVQISLKVAGCIKFDSNEYVGWGLYVLYLCFIHRIHPCQLSCKMGAGK